MLWLLTINWENIFVALILVCMSSAKFAPVGQHSMKWAARVHGDVTVHALEFKKW